MKKLYRIILLSLIIAVAVSAGGVVVRIFENNQTLRDKAKVLAAMPASDCERISFELAALIDGKERVIADRSGWRDGDGVFGGQTLGLGPDVLYISRESVSWWCSSPMRLNL